MGPVWLGMRAELRLRWPAMVGLALLLGLVAGVALTAAAGARRTETAYPRLLRWANAAQVDVMPYSGEPTPAYFAAMARLPEVASISTAVLYNVVLPARHGPPQTLVQTLASPDHALGASADRVKILQGRMFGPASVGEAVIDPELARLEGLRPGDTLRLLGERENPKTQSPDVRLAVPLDFKVSAIGVFDNQVVPDTTADGEPMALLSPSFAATPLAASITYGPQAGVRLKPGASLAAFLRAAAVLAKKYPETGGSIDVDNLSDRVACWRTSSPLVLDGRRPGSGQRWSCAASRPSWGGAREGRVSPARSPSRAPRGTGQRPAAKRAASPWAMGYRKDFRSAATGIWGQRRGTPDRRGGSASVFIDPVGGWPAQTELPRNSPRAELLSIYIKSPLMSRLLRKGASHVYYPAIVICPSRYAGLTRAGHGCGSGLASSNLVHRPGRPAALLAVGAELGFPLQRGGAHAARARAAATAAETP